MTSKLARILTASAFAVSITAFAQTDSAALPSAPSAAPTATSPVIATGAGGTKIGTINIEQAIFASNEGQRDFEALSKKLEPKQTELKGQNDELDSLKKQLNNDKITEESRSTLVKQIEQKQKALERSVQDARDDAQNQQGEIAQRILQKMAPILVKYAGDNGFALIMDVTKPWPDGPVLWAGPSTDITRPVVEAYNAQSGVPAPANAKPATLRPTAPGGSKPAGSAATKPAAPAAKPATPAKP